MIRRVATRTFGALLSAGVVLGCQDTGPIALPTLVRIEPGAATLDAVGASAALSGTVFDQNRNPLPRAVITWSSDDYGIARVTPAGLVTAAANGTAMITARSGEATASVRVTVAQVARRMVDLADGTPRVGAAGEVLPQPVEVRVSDRLGAPAADVEVAFAVVGGGGQVSPTLVRSDASGRAAASWALGTVAGQDQRVRATVGAGPMTVEFVAAALPGPIAGLTLLEGSGQTAPRNTELAEPLRVRANDRFGNSVPGAAVEFDVQSGGGVVEPPSTVTDDEGEAEARWILGLAVGPQRVVAEAASVQQAFDATAFAEPAALQATGGQDESAPVGSPVSPAPRVRVLDPQGLPAPGVAVTFEVTAGGGVVAAGGASGPSPTGGGSPVGEGSAGPFEGQGAPEDDVVVLTDAQGEASAEWRLGPMAGPQALAALVQNLPVLEFRARAVPGPAAELAVVSGDAQTGPRGAPLPAPLIVEVRDGFGNPVEGAVVTFAPVLGTGSLAPEVVPTGVDGRAQAEWTLGPEPGPQAARVATDEGLLAAFTAEATVEVVKAEVVAGAGQTGTVGTPLAIAPAVRVEDGLGLPVAGVAVTFAVVSGGGSVRGDGGPGAEVDVASGPDGVAALGAWTLGGASGPQQISVLAPGLEPLTIDAQATPGPAARLVAASGGGQTAPVGTSLPSPLVVRVLDAFDNRVPGVQVVFSGDGAAGPPGPLTDVAGEARTGWVLGPSAGPQSMTARAGALAPVSFAATANDVPEPYDIEVRWGSGATPSQRAAVDQAVSRWSAMIVDGLVDTYVGPSIVLCDGLAPAVDEIVDDLLLFIGIGFLDGPGGFRARAAPCLVRAGDGLTVVGGILLDEAEIGSVEAGGELVDLVSHELGHALGIGTLWDDQEMLLDPSLPDNPGADTHFTGLRAIAAFDAVGGAGYSGAKVPVENVLKGQGTRDVHWRESVFGNELMTAFLVLATDPISRVSVASLGDLGYVVDEDAAEGFSLPAGALLATPGGSEPLDLGDDVLRVPIPVVDPQGRVVRWIVR